MTAATVNLARRAWLCVFGILAIAASNLYWLSRNQINGDVAYYLWGGERMADGAVLYKDVADMNPPLIYLLQLPAVWIARAIHTQTHWPWYAGVWIAFAVILFLTRRLSDTVIPHRWIYPLMLAMTFSFGIAARQQFSQRDQLAGYGLVPLLLCCAGRMAGKAPDHRWALAAAAVGGLGIALKPYFLLPWALLISLTLIWPDLRRVRILDLARMPEFWLVAIVQGAYGAAILLIYPGFLPMAREASLYYKAFNCGLREFLKPWPHLAVLAAVSALLFAKRSGKLPAFGAARAALAAASVAAASGFFIEAVVQHKGLPYHLIPFLLFTDCALAAVLIEAAELWLKRDAPLTFVLGAATVAFAVWTAPQLDRPIYPEALKRAIQSDPRPGPILFLAADPWCAFPAVYDTGVQMAQRDIDLWMLPGIYRGQIRLPNGRWSPAQDARYHAGGEMPPAEKALLADLRHAFSLKPRLIYVQTGEKQGFGNLQFDYLKYISRDPEIARALAGYRDNLGDVAGPRCEPRCFTLLSRQ
jgi:hypothetical protein